MKRIAIENLASQISELTSLLVKETIVLTRDGKPFAFLSDASHYDWEDIGYMTDESFWKMIAQRRAEPATVTLEEVEAGIASREAAESEEPPRPASANKKKAS